MAKDNIQDLINKATDQARDNSRYKKEEKKTYYSGRKIETKKDPVVDWLESQPEVKKVHLDVNGLIIGADYYQDSDLVDVEVIN